MTLTGVGTAFSAFDYQTWQQIAGDMVRSYVPTGLAVTAKAASTRTVTVAAGRAYGAGATVTSSAAQDVALDAPTTASARIDLIVLRIDFSQPPASAFSITFHKGTSATTPPAPTRVNGGIWEIPLARVTVPGTGGSAQLTTANVVDARPLFPARTFTGQATVTIPSGGGTGSTTVTFPVGTNFVTAPGIQLTPRTGAAAGTVVNYWTANETTTSFDISASRTTGTDMTFTWTATA